MSGPPAREFPFASTWVLDAPAERVWPALEALLDSDDPFVWWPVVTVESRTVDELVASVRTPWGPRFRVRLHDVRPLGPSGRAFAADGDLVGEGTVVVEPDGDRALVRSTWHVDPGVGWLRRTARVLRPFHVAMHALVMRRGRHRLDAWLRAQGVVGRG